MKLYIFDEQYCDKKFWLNFRTGIDPEAWPGKILGELYNAKLITDVSYSKEGLAPRGPYIEFESEAQAVNFLLRWS